MYIAISGAFLVFGIVSLLPWNVFITAHDYYDLKWQNTTVESSFESYFSLSGSATACVGMFVNTLLIVRIPNKVRMISSHIIVILALIAALVFTLIDTASMKLGFFYITLVELIVAAFSSNIVGGACFGLASVFPSSAIESAVVGQAIAGLVVSVMSIFTHLAGGEGSTSAFAYFLIAIIITAFSLLAYIWLLSNRDARQYFQHLSTNLVVEDNAKGVKQEYNEDNGIIDARDEQRPLLTDDVIVSDDDDEPHFLPPGPDAVALTSCHHDRTGYWKMFDSFFHAWLYCAVVFLTFFVSLSCFPTLASNVESKYQNKRWAEFFNSVTCFLMFNLGDVLGRLTVAWVKVPKFGSKWILVLALLRSLFIGAFIFSNLPSSTRGYQVAFLCEDAVFAVLNLLFGLTNGYLMSLAFVYAPRCVPEDEAELVGSLVGFFAVFGILCGSGFSFFLVFIAGL